MTVTTPSATGASSNKRRQARHHEHAGGDHGRGVDEGGDRRRALHRVRQPGVQQELRRLAHGAHEQQQAGDGQRVDIHAEDMDLLADEAGRRGEDLIERDRIGEEKDKENAEREAEVADAVDDEGLDGGSVGRGLLIPEADEQIGGETDALPTEEHLHQIVGRHQHQHGEGEQRQIGEEPLARGILVHVADRIEMHERRHGGDDDEHDRRQAVDAQSPVHLDVARDDPFRDDRHGHRRGAERDLAEGDPRQRGRDEQQRGGDDFRRALAKRAAEQAGDQEAQKGEEDDCDVHCPLSPSSC
jgi:hypothetical protein